MFMTPFTTDNIPPSTRTNILTTNFLTRRNNAISTWCWAIIILSEKIDRTSDSRREKLSGNLGRYIHANGLVFLKGIFQEREESGHLYTHHVAETHIWNMARRGRHWLSTENLGWIVIFSCSTQATLKKAVEGRFFRADLEARMGETWSGIGGSGNRQTWKLRHLIERGLHCWSGEIYKTPPPFFCRVCRRPSTEPCTLIRNISTFSYENGGVLHQPTDGITATNSTPP